MSLGDILSEKNASEKELNELMNESIDDKVKQNKQTEIEKVKANDKGVNIKNSVVEKSVISVASKVKSNEEFYDEKVESKNIYAY